MRAKGLKGRVLVVDDDTMVARALSRVLSEHDVVVVERARDALSLLSDDEAFDVIFCDLWMPQMSGIDFYERLVSEHPALAQKVIFLTGGALTPGARQFLVEVPNACVEKPFEAGALQRLLSTRLSRPLS